MVDGTQRGRVARLLDLGCGSGATTWFLAREGLEAVAVDGSRAALERLSQRLAEEKLAAQLVPCDVTALPFEASSFDGVIDVACLCHNSTADGVRGLEEAHRVLRPGGRLLSIWPTTNCNRGPYKGKGHVEYLCRGSVELRHGYIFDNVQIGRSTYTLDLDETPVVHWVISAEKSDGSE